MADLNVLQSIWLVAIVALWVLYLVLEGFDFGVGMLLKRVRRDHLDRRVALHAIGPTWATNEVWAIIAVVGMFAAFPAWYSAWTAGLYLPLAVALLAIVARNAAIELLGKREDERWRRGWERVMVLTSVVAPFCWGLMWAAAIDGLALRGDQVTGSPLDAITPYSVLGGVALVALSRAQGAAYLTLRTGGEVRERARRELALAAPVAALVAGGFVVWTGVAHDAGTFAWIALAACGAALAAVALLRAPGRAFAAGSGAIALLVVAWFAVLFPEGIAARDGGTGIVLSEVASGDYTLTLMTVLTGVMLPLLLAVQAWTYWVFRAPVTRADVGEGHPSPVELIARAVGGRGDSGGAGSAGGGGAAGSGAGEAGAPGGPVGGPGFRGPGFRWRGGGGAAGGPAGEGAGS